jgi:hypothetical protein
MTALLIEHSAGRIILHVWWMLRGAGRIKTNWAGIMREVNR